MNEDKNPTELENIPDVETPENESADTETAPDSPESTAVGTELIPTEESETDESVEDISGNVQPSGEAAKPSLFSAVFETVETLVLYFSIAIAILLLLFTHSPVVGSSMDSTLKNGDLLIVRRFAYTPENGDIIVCQSENYGLEKPLVKRVIATEGQVVKIDYKAWTVTVDGKTLDEDYITKNTLRDMMNSDYLENEFTVPKNSLFVMGDNRNISVDSRSSEVGFIDTRYVVGKVSFRIFPFTSIQSF